MIGANFCSMLICMMKLTHLELLSIIPNFGIVVGGGSPSDFYTILPEFARGEIRMSKR